MPGIGGNETNVGQMPVVMEPGYAGSFNLNYLMMKNIVEPLQKNGTEWIRIIPENYIPGLRHNLMQIPRMRWEKKSGWFVSKSAVNWKLVQSIFRALNIEICNHSVLVEMPLCKSIYHYYKQIN